MEKLINPSFDMSLLCAEDIKRETTRIMESFAPTNHSSLLKHLKAQAEKLDYRHLAGLREESEKLTARHKVVITVEHVLQAAEKNNWGLCRNNGSIYQFNGSWWDPVETNQFEGFLGEVAETMGVEKFQARHYSFREQLYKQFPSAANMQKPQRTNGVVLINLRNGTFEITSQRQELRPPKREDFLTYQLPFDYDPKAKAPLFQAYLDRVQPDKDVQDVLAEYMGYVFIPSSELKMEKALMLYGSGANGKSVFFEVMNALLGPGNISSFSLESLTGDRGGNCRAQIADKLVNYASEISTRMEPAVFKAMVSGEPIEARPLYSQPYLISNYAKMIFNCNELPKDVEQSNAFFRRLLLVPFNVTIPEAEQDRELPRKIVDQELSGIFNWVLEGLRRLLAQKGFTPCESVERQIEQYRKQSDTVRLFLEDEGYSKDHEKSTPLKGLYSDFRTYCSECGYHHCSLRTFADRLRAIGYQMAKKKVGQVVFLKKESLL